MKLHHFIGNFKLRPGGIKVSEPELIGQIVKVLRLSTGEIVILSDGNLNEAEAEITELNKEFIGFNILKVYKNDKEPKGKFVLYCAVLKNENVEWVVQKTTELGISEIAPVITDRTVKLNLRHDRLQKIAREAAEQSGRGIVPLIHEPMDFGKAVLLASKINFFFDPSGENYDNPKIREQSNFGIWIGPEGGWTGSEIELAKNGGFKVINLGKLVLRAETAAVVGTYSVINNFIYSRNPW